VGAAKNTGFPAQSVLTDFKDFLNEPKSWADEPIDDE
jgi:hypothetical protein